jgi:diguanylate cyclase (GGDEF)-like protein/PAS domain S-box-containing protein
VAVISMFSCLSLVLFDSVELYLSRREHLAQAGREVANLAASLAQYSHGVFLTADTALIGLRDAVSHYGTGSANLPVLQGLMYQNLANLASLHGMFLFDTQGGWLVNTVPGTPPELNYADRDYFRFHQTHAADVRRVGLPIRSKADNSWILTVTRRVYAADGRFAGVVDATISTDLFQRFFANFDLGPHGSISLLDESGHILIRQPYLAANVGRDIGNSAGWQEAQIRGEGESFGFASALDGLPRMGAYHHVGGTALRILVSRSEADILAPWWQEARINIACLLLVVATALLLSHRIEVELRDRARAEHLYRLLADNSDDAIVCGSLSGYCRYASPSLCAITGQSLDALRGTGWLQRVPETDAAEIAAALHRLRCGENLASARYRYRHPDGAVVWVELRARITASHADTAPTDMREFVANIRDITRQKQAEEQLEDANAELSAMSVTDALTGIANRRHFDQMLRKEWNRAMRTASPVSLLMVDTDNFKAYNDFYGHPTGDQCLRHVAQALSSSVLRAGDLVTRYGGEEFAIILPDTIAEMGQQVGERMLAALERLAMPHQGAAGGVVSVSIGIASVIPEIGGNPLDLVAQADAALYAAKHAGRATIRVAPPGVPTTTIVPRAGQRNAA